MLNDNQRKIVEAKENYVVVNASAASGKTRVLTERVKYLLNNGVLPENIVMITFTNAAAYEMAKRIGSDAERMFIGTVHSFANRCLRGAGINTDALIAEENFDGLLEQIKRNPSCVGPVEHLLLDEAQDSSEAQFYFILSVIKPKNYMFVGDVKQAIYDFSGGRADIFEGLTKEPNVKVYDLNENYRNSYAVLDYARSIIEEDYYDNSIARTNEYGDVIFINEDAQDIARLIKYSDDAYNEWFVLTRSNAQLDEIYQGLTFNGIPCDSFKRAELSSDELIKKMAENTVKVLTIHTAKGLECKNVVVIGANRRTLGERRVSYVAATRAISTLYWAKGKRKRAKNKTNIFDNVVQW